MHHVELVLYGIFVITANNCYDIFALFIFLGGSTLSVSYDGKVQKILQSIAQRQAVFERIQEEASKALAAVAHEGHRRGVGVAEWFEDNATIPLSHDYDFELTSFGELLVDTENGDNAYNYFPSKISMKEFEKDPESFGEYIVEILMGILNDYCRHHCIPIPPIEEAPDESS